MPEGLERDPSVESATATGGGPSAEMPRYKCYKEVYALKIGAIEIHEDGGAHIAPSDPGFAPFEVDEAWVERFKGGDDEPGYYVVYADGYKSWSPTKVFEEGYTRL